MNKPSPMKRLLQGDVGSGKTIVAAAAIYASINSSHQAVLMAPTEVLAEQHYNSLSKVLKYKGIIIFLLTSSTKDRDQIMKIIKDVIIGMKDPNPLVAGKGIRKLKKAFQEKEGGDPANAGSVSHRPSPVGENKDRG